MDAKQTKGLTKHISSDVVNCVIKWKTIEY